jgi:hypothetical protein
MAENSRCDQCKEKIHPDALKCRYCGALNQPRTLAHGGTCPYCKEGINEEARRCPHCKSDVATVAAAPEHGGRCYFCKEDIHRDAKVCRHCGSDVSTDPARVALMAPMDDLGAGCGVTCQSDDGRETCCCGVGKKCVKGVGFCECKDASGITPGGGSFGGGLFPGYLDLGRLMEMSGAEVMTGPMTMPGGTPPVAFAANDAGPSGGVVYKEFCFPWPVWICTGTPGRLRCRLSWQKYCIKVPVPAVDGGIARMANTEGFGPVM